MQHKKTLLFVGAFAFFLLPASAFCANSPAWLGDSTLTQKSIGALRIGQTLQEAQKATGSAIRFAADDINSNVTQDHFDPTAECAIGTISDLSPRIDYRHYSGISVLFDQGKISGLSIYPPPIDSPTTENAWIYSIQTTEGLTLHDGLQQLKAIYKERIKKTTSQTYEISHPDGGYSITMQNGFIYNIKIGYFACANE